MICVGGGSMKRFGFLDKATDYLREAGMEVELFEGIEPDPSVETVMRGAEAMIRFQHLRQHWQNLYSPKWRQHTWQAFCSSRKAEP